MDMAKAEGKKKRKIAWGITGSGDRIVETVETMKKIRKQYQNEVNITAYLSKAGDLVIKYYSLGKDLKENFDKIRVEINSNTPFLAGQLQTTKYDFLLIAPTTSNTVAKIATGIGDTLLSNSAIMALKAFVPVYIMPSDYQEGMTTTQLPDGQMMKIRVRKEDVEHVKKLASMDGVFILETPEEIQHIFQKHFKPEA